MQTGFDTGFLATQHLFNTASVNESTVIVQITKIISIHQLEILNGEQKSEYPSRYVESVKPSSREALRRYKRACRKYCSLAVEYETLPRLM